MNFSFSLRDPGIYLISLSTELGTAVIKSFALQVESEKPDSDNHGMTSNDV